MPTPLPDEFSTRLGPPDALEAQICLDAVLTAVDPGDGPTELQMVLMEAGFFAMTGHQLSHEAEVTPRGLAEQLADRNEAYRNRILQTMILGAMVLRPLPTEVARRVTEYAEELSVDDGMLAVAQRFAAGHLGLAAFDFERNGYTADWEPSRAEALHASVELRDAWQQSLDDPALAGRWQDFEHLPPGSLGRRVWELYRARGFAFPGSEGSAPPLLAQHDFVHVLADYGTRVESELEVFAFIARANDDPRGFSLLAMVVSLFETGYLASGAGLFESFPGQLSQEGMAQRLADALRRGALSHGLGDAPDVDFLAVDWFGLAGQQVADLRAEFGIVEKDEIAVGAGSVGPWEPGGISPYQYDKAMEAAGSAYESYGATPG